MKLKKIVLILMLGVFATSIFAADVAIDELQMIDVRSLGMGGTHITDTNDFYTLFKNPAGLALTGKKGMISVITVNVGGPLEKGTTIVNDLNAGKKFDEILPNLIKDGLKANVNVALDGPLCFGGISKNGFGWGFYETVNVDANVPSLTLAKVTAQVEAGLMMGYGFKIDIGAGTSISVGVTADAFAKVPRLAIQDSVANIISTVQGNGLDNLPITAAYGVSCDAGAQVRLFNFIDAAIVWEDFCSPYVTKDTTLGDVQKDPSVITPNFNNVKWQSQNFRVGAGINVLPNGALGGLISALKVQADIKDFMLFFRHFIDRKLSSLEKSPWLNFTAGAEVGLMRFIYARVGYHDGYASVGASIKLGAFNIDAALYTNELGRAPGANNQMNVAVSVGLHY